MVASIRGSFAALLFALCCSACVTQVRNNVVQGPFTERRTRLDQSGAIGESTWRWDGHRFSGKIEWELCRIETSWKETEQRISSTRPHAVAPYLLFAAGTALVTTSFIIRDYDGVERECARSDICYDKPVSNTIPTGMLLAGASIAGSSAGLAAFRLKPDVEVSVPNKRAPRRPGPASSPRISPS